METFSFNTPLNLSEERKWFLAVTNFEAKNSVFNITVENNSISITKPGHWERSAEKTFNELNQLLELKSQNAFELHVKKLGKEEIK